MPQRPLETPRAHAEGTILVGPSSDQAQTPAPALVAEPRYLIEGELGRGGMGEVFAASDRVLRRGVALKALLPKLMDHPENRARFEREACIIAALEHPAIIPVHDLGKLEDGRPFYAMKDVRTAGPERGETHTLTAAIAEVHAASTGGQWVASPSGWTFHRLVDALLRASEGVACAHARGVTHCDLKPENVLLGEFGEVLVIDWGLAQVTGPLAEVLPPFNERAGAVRGTPAYMAPEQARGQTDQIGPRSDVYALGAILYQLLCARPPYEGRNPMAVLRQVLAGPPEPPGRVALEPLVGATLGYAMSTLDGSDGEASSPLVPAELQLICQTAMARDASERYADASAFAAALSSWIEGARRREQALELVAKADAQLPQIAGLRRDRTRLLDEAAGLLSHVAPWMPLAQKLPAWQRQDEAARMALTASRLEVEHVQLLQGALMLMPDLKEAHERLADHYQRQHQEAEQRADATAAAQVELLLRAHDLGRHARYLRGEGALTLVTDPPGARVIVQPLVTQNRRLVPGAPREIGRTPLYELSLPMGSHLVRLRAPGRAEVLYPLHIGRMEHWHGCRPGQTTPEPLSLPASGAIGDQERLVAAGPFVCGGDPEAPGAGPATSVWLDSFIIRLHPVSNAEYLVFLNDLLACGREDEALAAVPRERAGVAGGVGAMIYGRAEDGRFILAPDEDGDLWLPDWPVVHIDWFGARAYAAWEAERTGLPWRLPRELEREKAARGPDGRRFPWGDHFDATWACTRESHEDRPRPAEIHLWPEDLSPYGVRGLAGNARDWCLDPWRPGGALVLDGQLPELGPEAPDVARVIRGGNWSGGPNYARSASRDADVGTSRKPYVGVRLVR